MIGRAVRTTALSLAALALGAVGVAFLTGAAYMALSEELGAVAAAAIVGVAYLLAGGGALALAGRRPARSRQAAAQGVSSSMLMQAFLTGMTAGTAAGRRR